MRARVQIWRRDKREREAHRSECTFDIRQVDKVFYAKDVVNIVISLGDWVITNKL